ncbi:MAG: nitronate monooxygenase, partial [Bauldia litoralis]
MWPDTRLLDLFGIDRPLVQAPMAGCAGLDMACAVSEAGGLGSLAGTLLDAPGLRALIEAARAATDRPLNINFFAHDDPSAAPERDAAWLARLAPYFGELALTPPGDLAGPPILPFDDARCAVIEEMPPAVVSFHFGLPGPELVARVKAAGCRVISSATTVAEAVWLADRGCDAIIAQGAEAGGHRGMFLTEDVATKIGTLALVPQVADAVDVPVIAAGG